MSLSQLESFITLFSPLSHQARVVREQLVGNWPPAKVNPPQPPVKNSHIQICILCLSLLPCTSEKFSGTSEGSNFSVSSVQAVVNISKICSLLFPSLPKHGEIQFSQSVSHAPPPWQAWVAPIGLSPLWYSIFLHYRAQTRLHKCQTRGKDGYPLANSHPSRWLAISTTSFPWAIPAPLQCCFLASPHLAQTGA